MNCLHFSPYSTSTTMPAEFMMSPLFNLGSIWMHECALGLLFLQSMSIFNNFEQTAWIGSTLARAVGQLLNAFIVYFSIVTCFSFLVYISFGGDCKQFSTVGDTMWALMLFSFGIHDVASARTEPRFYLPSKSLYNYLLVFQILSVLVVLNVFTTIIIDAYTSSKHDAWRSASISNQIFVWSSCTWIFPNIDLENARDDDVRQAIVDYDRIKVKSKGPPLIVPGVSEDDSQGDPNLGRDRDQPP